MARRTQSQARDRREREAAYSLWTAPPQTWSSPIESDLQATDLEAKLSQLELKTAEDNEQTKAFKTPVTPDVLSRPTQG